MLFTMQVCVGQQGHANPVEHFDALHVNALSNSGLDIEGDEIEIVVSLQRVAIEFHVALDLQVLPRINERPGRC